MAAARLLSTHGVVVGGVPCVGLSFCMRRLCLSGGGQVDGRASAQTSERIVTDDPRTVCAWSTTRDESRRCAVKSRRRTVWGALP